jgi:hypothetical protein
MQAGQTKQDAPSCPRNGVVSWVNCHRVRLFLATRAAAGTKKALLYSPQLSSARELLLQSEVLLSLFHLLTRPIFRRLKSDGAVSCVDFDRA